jgi:hypothetical protein
MYNETSYELRKYTYIVLRHSDFGLAVDSILLSLEQNSKHQIRLLYYAMNLEAPKFAACSVQSLRTADRTVSSRLGQQHEGV